MTLESTYPVLMTNDVAAAAAFWVDTFGFEQTFAADWYVSLRRDRWELAVVDADHPTVPASHRGRPAGGLLVNLEVDDVDAEYARLRDSVDIALPLRSEPFGQRHFVVAGPDGVIVDVITPIPPEAEYVASFV